MKCPACQSALVVIEREEIEVDWCPSCHGLWFDEGELELLGEKAGRIIDTEDLGRLPGDSIEKGQRRCPRCPRKMERVILAMGSEAPVEVDRCRDHGFWLDRGELSTILSRLKLDNDTDEELVLEFLGETFECDAAPAPQEGSQA
jgi:Zn-finger nucleic acid-binding protein